MTKSFSERLDEILFDSGIPPRERPKAKQAILELFRKSLPPSKLYPEFEGAGWNAFRNELLKRWSE